MRSLSLMRKQIAGRWGFPVILVLLLVGFSILIFLSKGFYGGGDSIAHYRISRYAFKYPHLFLDHWGKPVFTILSSVFSQFGFNGLRFYNLLAAAGTSWFLVQIIRKLNMGSPLMVPVFLFFAPLYFILLFSGLTEITFGLVMMAGIYFWFKKAPGWSALILSLMPFVRTEAVILMPVFMVVFVLFGRLRYLPLFFFGFVAFSLVGWPYYHDIFWVIHQIPYTGAKDIYGSGSFFYFFHALPLIMGWPLLILFLSGLVAFFLPALRKQMEHKLWAEILFMVLLPLCAYFLAHSFAWWKGMGGSLGLIRVMAAIVPPGIIFCFLGYGFLEKMLGNNTLKKIILPLIFIPAIIYVPFNNQSVPLRLDPQHQLLKKAAEWVRDSGEDPSRIYYHDLFFIHCLGGDPFDREHYIEKIPDRNQPGEGIPPGSLIQWDAHYGPNEGGVDLESLLKSDSLELVLKLSPDEPFYVLGGNPYEIYIFRKK